MGGPPGAADEGRRRVKREKLGERIKRLRKEQDLGLRVAATQLGISATYLSRIENCQESSPPAERVIRACADLFEDDFDELMQLAGRVPEDVEEMIMRDPGMPAFLRTAREQKVSAADLMKLLEAKKKRGGK